MSELTSGKVRTRRGLGSVDLVHSWVNRIKIVRKDQAEKQEQIQVQAQSASVAERRAELLAFYDRYETYVELLCDAAQYGPAIRLESAYAEQRVAFVRSYASLSPYLHAYLRGEIDAFVELTRCETLEEFIRSDNGNVIEWITQTREALTLYGEHLRQLAAAKG